MMRKVLGISEKRSRNVRQSRVSSDLQNSNTVLIAEDWLGVMADWSA
jgi:hypothetical protein